MNQLFYQIYISDNHLNIELCVLAVFLIITFILKLPPTAVNYESALIYQRLRMIYNLL